MCRLRVDLPLVRARLAQRHEAESEALQWYLARAEELDTIMEAAAIEDFTVDATDLSTASTAKTVLSSVGWRAPFPSPSRDPSTGRPETAVGGGRMLRWPFDYGHSLSAN